MLMMLDSWGPCAWIIVAEVWPLSTRPYGTSLGASSNWMNNFMYVTRLGIPYAS